MEKMEKRKIGLEKILNLWKSITQAPRMFIDENFSRIRTQIDLAIETALLKLPDSIESKETSEKEYDRLNSIREEMIQLLREQEKKLIAQVPHVMEGHAWKLSSEALARVDQEIDSTFASYSESIDYYDVFVKIGLQILGEVCKLQQHLLGNQTFMFFDSDTNPGVLVHLADLHFNMIERDCFETYLEHCKPNVFKSFETLDALTRNQYQRYLGRRYNKPYVVNEMMPRMAFLAMILKGALLCDQMHVIRLDRKFLDLEFDQPLTQAHQELKDALHEWLKEHDRHYERYLTTRRATKHDPIEYATQVNRPEFVTPKVTQLSLQPSYASRIKMLDLSQCELTNFEETFFRSLKSAHSLQLVNAFKIGTNFNLNFLQHLTSFTSLDATLPDAFDFSWLHNNDLHSLNLATSSTLDTNKPRIKLCPKSFNIISSMGKLDNLQLNGFEMTPNQLSNLPNMLAKMSSGLGSLNLANNKLTHIPGNTFENFWHLRTLNLSSNLLSSLPASLFAGLTGVSYMDLSRNSIADLPDGIFDSLVTLRRLDLSRNKITRIQSGLFSKLRSLYSLTLSKNPITSIDATALNGLDRVDVIDLSHCKLKAIQDSWFKDLSGLNSIYLSHNQIDSIWLQVPGRDEPIQVNKGGLTDQEIKLVRENKLVRVNMFGRNRRGLELSNNHLEEFNMIFYCNLDSIQIPRVDLSNNKLRRIFNQSPDELSIYDFNLSNNRLEHLGTGFFRSIRGLQKLVTFVAFGACCPELRNLTLSNNSLQVIKAESFTGLFKLTKVNLSSNLIESLDPEAFAGCDELRHLNISGNKLTNINPAIFKHVKHLDLSNNKLDTIDHDMFRNTRSLNELNLSGNGIKKLDIAGLFKKTSSLTHVDLSHNQLDNASIDQAAVESLKLLGELRELSLSHNQLTDLSFVRDLTWLLKLDVSNNKINSIYDDNGQNVLGRLFLRTYLIRLHLDLSHNQIRRIKPTDIVDFNKRLDHFDISGNPVSKPRETEPSRKRRRISND